MTKNKAKIEVKHETSTLAPTPATTPMTAPAPAEGWAPFLSLRDEVDRLFNDFGAGFWKRPLSRDMFGRIANTASWHLSPAVEVVDCDGEYRLTAELPGMAPEDVEIRMADGTITIRGEKTEDKKEEKDDYILSERRYGSFHRALPVPAGIEPGDVSAHFANGVLTVTMPKSKEAKEKERRIEVKAA